MDCFFIQVMAVLLMPLLLWEPTAQLCWSVSISADHSSGMIFPARVNVDGVAYPLSWVGARPLNSIPQSAVVKRIIGDSLLMRRQWHESAHERAARRQTPTALPVPP